MERHLTARAVSPATPGLAEALAVAGLEPVDGEVAMPLFNADAVSAALVDARGEVVRATPAFTAIRAERRIDPERLARAFHGAPPSMVAVDLAEGGGEPDTALFVYASAAQTTAWRLPPDLREAADRHPGHVVVLTSHAARAARPLEDACLAYGLSGLQTRVVMAVIQTGTVKAAAAALGIAYDTAREAMSAAMQRARAPRLSALVTRLTSQAFGILPEADVVAVLGDQWGLSARQAAIAGLVASGASRTAAASALSVSEAVVRKELEQVHLILQVSSSAALARKLVEANALRWLTGATGGDLGFADAAQEPLRFVHRLDGRRIAVSDYGPASGRPLLVIHSNLTCRAVARGLLRALQSAGFRPIAIDRPGFGLTDEIADAERGRRDPFAAAASDALLVLDALKLRQVDLVARGAAQVVLALARGAPDRLGRVVLVNPAPHAAESGRRAGPIGALKEAYLRNPALIRLVAPFYIRRGDFGRLIARLQGGAQGSPPDEAAMADPEIMADMFRAMRPFGTGRIAGYVNELSALMRLERPQPLADASEWRVLLAEHDFLHDPEVVLAYWRKLLPGACFTVVPDTGRYLAISHPRHVAEALTGAAG